MTTTFRPASIALRCVGLLVAVLWPLRIRAIFGIGDIVYDPANVAQTINVLTTVRDQLDRLGSLLGVSTQQYDQLLALAASLGNSGEAAGFAQAATPARIEAQLQSIPGLENASAAGVFLSDGALDAFLGLPVAAWIAAVEHPDAFYRQALAAPIPAAAGASAAGYTSWYAGRTPEDQQNASARAAPELAGLLAADWLGTARQRRANLQALASASRTAETSSASAQTLSDQQNAHAQLTARTNQILLETAAQAAAAQEAAVRGGAAQNRLLQAAGDERRDAAVMLLDGSL